MPTRKKRRSEETSLSKAIQQVLTAKGARVVRIQSGLLEVVKGEHRHRVHCAPNGTPDLLVIVPPSAQGRGALPSYVWLEVKTKTGKPNADQLAWHAWAEANRVRVAVVRSISEALAAVFPLQRSA